MLPRWVELMVVVALILLLVGGLFHAMAAIFLNTNLQGGDQGAYLRLSLDQLEGRRFTDGNRHPLYSLLLLPLADRSPEFFAKARWVSLVIGFCIPLLVEWKEWKERKDPLSAILGVSFLACQVQMIRTYSEIWCEPLLYLLVLWLWYRTHALTTEPTTPITSPWLYHGINGVITGLLFLTKGTGLQVAVLFWIMVLGLTISRKVGLKRTLIEQLPTSSSFSGDKQKVFSQLRYPGVGLVVFFIVSAPLFYWNIKTYGDPLYSFASTHNMWFDEADEIWYDDPSQLPTLGSYLQTHSVVEIMTRLLRGLQLEAQMLVQVLVHDWKLPDHASTLAVWMMNGFKLLIGAGLLWIILSSWQYHSNLKSLLASPPILLLGILAVFLIPSFGWYAQLTHEPRFLMTLIPPLVVLIARSLSTGLQGWIRKQTGQLQHVLYGAVCLIAMGFALFAFATCLQFLTLSRSLPSPQLTPLQDRMIQQLELLPEGANLAFGPSHGLPLWMSRGDLGWHPTPWRIDEQRFRLFIDREKITHVLVDSETLARRDYLMNSIGAGGEQPYNWRLLYRDRDPGNFFFLYAVR